MNTRLAVAVALLPICFACSEQKPAVVQASATPPPKWMQDQKPVEIPAELKKLAEAEDPDLKKQLSPEEVKAALAAAQPQATPSVAAVSLNVKSSGEWEKLSDDQKRRNEAYERQLEQVVFIGPNEQYHTGMCATLTIDVMENGYMRRRFIGTNTTIRAAKSAGKSRHADCGAPAAEYSYR